jgi:hypothetical protein
MDPRVKARFMLALADFVEDLQRVRPREAHQDIVGMYAVADEFGREIVQLAEVRLVPADGISYEDAVARLRARAEQTLSYCGTDAWPPLPARGA